MTLLYYCLAKTIVNGEVIIQDNTVTYSASTSAFDSSNVSFKDAAAVATINSNAAAIIAARKLVDDILLQYAYVLSDESIMSMINNSLKTTIQPIIPIALASIASTVDGINYLLNKDTTIALDEYLLIPSGQNLTVDLTQYVFDNNGFIQVGDKNPPLTDCVGCSAIKSTATASTSPCPNCYTQLSIVSAGKTYSTTNTGTYVLSVGCCLEVDSGAYFVNYGPFTNQGGCITLLGGKFVNATQLDPPQTGTLNNSVSGTAYGTFYSSPQG
jgi:hypothetical protein